MTEHVITPGKAGGEFFARCRCGWMERHADLDTLATAIGFHVVPPLRDEAAAALIQGTVRPRWCYAVIPGQRHPERGYIPSIVTEGESGHAPLVGRDDDSEPWYWGTTWEQAQATAASCNADLGLSPEDVDEIMASSIRASIREGSAAERASARIARAIGQRP